MEDLLKCLVDLNVTSPQTCDKTSSEFKSFVDDYLPKLRLEFEKFSPEKDRLDNFSSIPLQCLSIAMYLLSLSCY